MPACPKESKPKRSINVARCVRNTGMCSGEVANAALVQRPAVTEMPLILVPSRSGTTTISSWTCRWTLETRLAFNTNGASPPSSNQFMARTILCSESIGASLTRDSPRRCDRSPLTAIRSCPNTVILPSRNQRISAEPSPSGRLLASSPIATNILRQSVTAPRTSRSTFSSSISSARRSLASTRPVSR